MRMDSLPFLSALLLTLTLMQTGCDAGDNTDKAAEQHGEVAQERAPAPSTLMLDDRWRQHLAAMPGGQISASGALVVRFAHAVVDQEQVGVAQPGVAQLLPEHPAQVVFTAQDRLEIRPQKPLPRGQRFTLSLYAQGLDGVDDSLSPANFSLTVMQQHLTLNVARLKPAAQADGMVLTGHLQTRDRAPEKAVAAVLEPHQAGQNLTVEWQHGAGGLRHDFTVSGIARGEDRSELTLRWDGEPLGVSNQGEETFTVPARQHFAVTTARTVSYPSPHVEVSFSEPLQGDQNRQGLITLNDKPARVEVDGSRLRVYPTDEDAEQARLRIDPALRSAGQGRLSRSYEKAFALLASKPGVRFVGDGTILPDGEVLSVPFEAAGVHSVKVQAFQVFDDNLGQYLQNNYLNQADTDSRTGRYLWQKTLTLPNRGEGWQRHQLDLTELMANHPNGLLHLTLTLDGDDIDYVCPGEGPTEKQTLPENNEGPGQSRQRDTVYEQYYQDAGYLSWSERDNPCSDSYYRYNDRASSQRAFMASNLGLLAKRGQNDQLQVVVTQLDSNEPAGKVALTAYNYQQQVVAKGQSNDQGMATLTLDGTPFYLKAEQDEETGYLKLARNRALPTNQFNTGGQSVVDGLKGFFYGERDVWRPGDAIHLTFILEDNNDQVPDDHPLTLDWFDPRGNKVKSYTLDNPVGNVYAFTLHTDEDAPTGNWRAVARLGERYFDTPLRVETVKPNRLKIDLGLPDTLYANEPGAVTLFARWLNGATAANLKSDVKVRVRPRTSRFDGYQGFQFDDPTRQLDSEPFTAFEASLNAQGKAQFPLNITASGAPGMLRATLTTRVFETPGDYSTQVRSVPVYPFKQWVGLRVPEGDGWGGALGRDSDHTLDLISLDSDGQPQAGRPLDITLYKIDWRWWWDQGEDDLSHFISDPHTHQVRQARLTSNSQGRAQWTLAGEDYDWGRHLIRVCDTGSNHCSAETVYLGWSRDQASGSQDAATRLSLSADQDHYQVGDTARVQLPATARGRLLVSLETGTQVLDHYWVRATGEPQTLEIPVTAAMAPNVYVHVALLQPHHQRGNDRPLRLYGVVPLMVNDPATRLTPQVTAPDQVKPEEGFTVAVSEQDGKPMTYTLALVDEGLLGLTNFRTPDPHQAFYQREALGVLTWDLFDMVAGAYGAELSQLLSLGGADDLNDGQEKQRRRFPPVVKFLGPFQLEANETGKHPVTLPPYMGQVRAMVVAADDGAYGNAERDITVTQPLTLLSSLPRVLGPGETVSLPVTVFVSEEDLEQVDVSVDVDSDFFSVEQGQARLTFTEPGDQIAMLRLKARDKVGTGRITVNARGGGHRTSETVQLPVRAANPATTRETRKALDPGDTWALDYRSHGLEGTNNSIATVSRLPAMGLERRLDFLLGYPHGCVEQITSTVLPQLYLASLVDLEPAEKQTIQDNISAGIERLKRFQLASGGFSYWPGQAQANNWGTSYAGHFLLEAKRLGYAVPAAMLNDWQRYQARRSRRVGEQPWNWNSAAYRHYTLALAGEPQVGAMNRLRERLSLAGENHEDSASYQNSRWLLAAAYQQMGLTDVAGELIAGSQGEARRYGYDSHSFGSRLRDQAIRLMVAQSRGDGNTAWELADAIAGQLADSGWLSTQSTAWSLMAMARYAGHQNLEDGYDLALREGKGAWQSLHVTAPVYQHTLATATDNNRAFSVRNDSESTLFATLSHTGTPPPGKEETLSQGLALQVQFHDAQGPVDVTQLQQGQDFRATVTVTNTGSRTLDNLALTQVLPSGWQLTSSRLDGSAEDQGELSYQDLRDDRVLSYFDLKPGAEHAMEFTLALNASFAGRFYLPSWQVQAQYQGNKQARTAGQWVDVVR